MLIADVKKFSSFLIFVGVVGTFIVKLPFKPFYCLQVTKICRLYCYSHGHLLTLKIQN